MPEPMEKRAVERLPIKLPFLYRPVTPDPVKSALGWTHDLSTDGACLELQSRLPGSSTVRLLFQTDDGSLDLSATVVWTSMIREKGEGILHGVSFGELAPDRRYALRMLIHIATSPAPPLPAPSP